MQENKQTLTVIDKDVYLVHQEEEKIPVEPTPVINIDTLSKEDEFVKKRSWLSTKAPTFIHYFALIVIGSLAWGYLWCLWGENWGFNGPWFRLAIVAVIAWASGLIFQEMTTLPPLLAALATGILARHLGFLDMRAFPQTDIFMRRIYPVIILGKGSLSWDMDYIKRNWRQVLVLGALPWSTEVFMVAVCTHFLLGFPWIWGFLLGSIYASVSCPVVMPSVIKHGKNASGKVNWPQLICTAGGLDTTLSVCTFGILLSFMFYDTYEGYRYIKAILALPVGVALGVAFGSLAKYVPNSKDAYVTELRILFVLAGGLFGNVFTSALGWGGTGGVAVLACNATAANHWSKKGWKLNQNPASTAYRVLWSACEPVLFAYTGTYVVVHSAMTETMVIGFGILLICLTIRLIVTTLVCKDLTLKQKIFVCCAWTPKTIVEAVLCPTAISAVLRYHSGDHKHAELIYAEQSLRLIVQAIIITTPIGYVLTNVLGPLLLQNNTQDDCENKANFAPRKSSASPEDIRL